MAKRERATETQQGKDMLRLKLKGKEEKVKREKMLFKCSRERELSRERTSFSLL